MARATLYPPANASVQNFAGRYPGRTFSSVGKIVLHTTESGGWPGYQSGADAPNLTASPDAAARRLVWRQHFPLNMSARALVNLPGGVQTNQDDVVQVEMVGTCVDGGPGLYWPGAPDWALQGIADFVRFMHDEWGVPYNAPSVWLPPGTGSCRMSPAAWEAFRGVCGHEHVPENDHQDPGRFPIRRVFQLAGGGSGGTSSYRVPGSVADMVHDMQVAIHVAVDHEWGPVTDQAVSALHEMRDGVGPTVDVVRRAQRAVGVSDDGIWGPKSRAAYIETVKALQAAWRYVDADLAVDGVWGPVTESAYARARSIAFMKF